ncbi:MAG: shikimate kinase [Acidimicrobiia bacterium]
MTLWLVGMMGSGKTSAGRVAAERLGIEFADTDEAVARRLGCSIAQLWGELGEAAFRDMEKVAVRELASREGIVATGGGVVLDAENRHTMVATGPVVWLEAPPSVLAGRLEGSDGRPLLVVLDRERESVLAQHLQERAKLYAEVATHRIQTDTMTVEEVAARIEEVWNGS